MAWFGKDKKVEKEQNSSNEKDFSKELKLNNSISNSAEIVSWKVVLTN